MKRHSLIKNAAEIGLRDVERRQKRHQSRYDRVGPGHIPGVRVVMDLDATTEYFALFISKDVQELVPVLRDCPASSRSLKAQLDPETGDRVAVDSPGTNIDLPGDLWPVLIVLKVLLVQDWDGDELFLDPHDRSALAQTIEMATFLGCDGVRDGIEHYLRKRWLELHKAQTYSAPGRQVSITERPADVLAYISLSKVMEALPDGMFSTAARPGADDPLLPLSHIVQLPPQLQVKWLRTDCTTFLDLSSPGNIWLIRHWQSLAGCVSAVPSLVGLRVTLPCKPEEKVNSFQDRTRFAHRDAIAALQQAGMHLPRLKFLHLMGSPVHSSDLHRLTAALVAFSASLTHLQLDVFDTSAKYAQFMSHGGGRELGCSHRDGRVDPQTTSLRCMLFGALSQMLKLKVLILTSWNTVIGGECPDAVGRALRSMPKLSCVYIDEWPCTTCQGGADRGGCISHPCGVTFGRNNIAVGIQAAGGGAVHVAPAQAAGAR